MHRPNLLTLEGQTTNTTSTNGEVFPERYRWGSVTTANHMVRI